jgi:beta-galactosidase
MFRKDGRVLFNDGWKFSLDGGEWRDVELPHDWLIGDCHNLYKSGEGQYRKLCSFSEEDVNNSVELYFDGVYMNCTIYINGEIVSQWKNGYTAFFVEISDFLYAGENEIMVKVLYESPNSRWYSGAGIYRNVWLIKQNKSHIVSDGVYINADAVSGNVTAEVDCVGDYDEIRSFVLGEEEKTLRVRNPRLWSPESPHLYVVQSDLIKDGEVIDTVHSRFGFRSIEFNPEKGFILNHEPIKLHGVCMHHDLGALGAAVNANAIQRQLDILKGMGVNAIRTAHNPPASAFLRLCDEMGFLVIDEFSDVWEMSKTEFDYARFFPQWYKKDVEAWVKRDRNHPCVIMWSIGNEIYDTHSSPRGLYITRKLYGEVTKHDPHGNAQATIGSNFMMSENGRAVADFLTLAGYNYGEQMYDEHRNANPNRFIYGSETASAVRSRGIYHFPIEVPLLTHDDRQCSDLGNSAVGWGRSNESAWVMDRDRHWCGGQFVWTGFDYLGEPTPYSGKNSYFGAADTAGLPKSSYYFYKAVWGDRTDPTGCFVKIIPHWDWNEGQLIDVITYSNLKRVELFLNGESLGEQSVDFANNERLHCRWKVKYEKGELTAKAYGSNGEVAATDRVASFGDVAELRTSVERYGDLLFYTISAHDENGEFVANARNRVSVKAAGDGKLLGLDNGDSTDYDSYHSDSRRLFSGKLVAIVQSNSPIAGSLGVGADLSEIPVRKIELSVSRRELDADNPIAEITAQILPENATYSDIYFKCVRDNGIEANIAEIKGNTVVAKGDGNFRLCAYCKNGGAFPQIVSELEMSVSGLGVITRTADSFATFTAASNDRIYGDGYKIAGESVEYIGNNVVLEFHEMDFGDTGATQLTVCGSTPNDKDNTIRINHGGKEQLVEFKYSYPYVEQTFDIERLTDKSDLTFTFLPGSGFNFAWFKFKP